MVTVIRRKNSSTTSRFSNESRSCCSGIHDETTSKSIWWVIIYKQTKHTIQTTQNSSRWIMRRPDHMYMLWWAWTLAQVHMVCMILNLYSFRGPRTNQSSWFHQQTHLLRLNLTSRGFLPGLWLIEHPLLEESRLLRAPCLRSNRRCQMKWLHGLFRCADFGRLVVLGFNEALGLCFVIFKVFFQWFFGVLLSKPVQPPGALES